MRARKKWRTLVIEEPKTIQVFDDYLTRFVFRSKIIAEYFAEEPHASESD